MTSSPTVSVRSRFHDLCAGRLPADRLPLLEWAPWWDQTTDRWKREGLDPALDMAGLKRLFGQALIPGGTNPWH